MTTPVTQCNLCNQSDYHMRYTTQDRLLNIPGNFSVNTCNHCGLAFLSTKLTRSELQKHYPDTYAPFVSPKNSRTAAILRTIKLHIYKQLNSAYAIAYWPLRYIVRRTIAIRPGGKLLDVGCGNGRFLFVARDLGMRAYGIDNYSHVDQIPNGTHINVTNASIETAQFEPNTFDVITLNHVLEHVEDPMRTMRKLYNILKPGGIIIIQVPNIDSITSHVFNHLYFGIDSPRHTHLFNPDTLRLYAKKTNLKIASLHFIVPLSNDCITMSAVYVIESLLHNGAPLPWLRTLSQHIIVRLLVSPIALIISLLGKGDGLEVWLTKK